MSTREEKELRLAKLERLEELEALEAQEQPSADEPVVQEEEEVAPVEIGTGEAMIAAGVEAVPFLKDAISVGMTLSDGTENFGERYNKNKQEWDNYINEAEAQHGAATTIADIGVSAAALPFTGLKAAAGLGAVTSLSRSEDREAEDALVGGILGVAGFGMGAAVGKGITKVGSMIKNQASKGVLEAGGAISPRTRKKALDHVQRAYQSEDVSRVNAVKAMSDDILKAKASDGQSVFKDTFQDVYTTSVRSKDAKNVVGKQIGSILKKSSDELEVLKGEDVLHDIITRMDLDDASIEAIQDQGSKKLKLELRNEIEKNFIGKPTKKKIGEKTIKSIGKDGSESVEKIDVFQDVPTYKDRSLNELHQMKVEMGARLSNKIEKAKSGVGSATATDEAMLVQLGVISDIVSDSVEVSEIAAKRHFKDLNRQWQTLNLVENMSSEHANKTLGGPMEQLKSAMNVRGLMVGGVAAVGGISKTAAATVAIGLNTMISSPRTPVALAKGATKLGNFIKANPNSPMVKRITVASTVSTDALRKAVESSISQINLMEDAVARNSEDVINKSDDVLTVVNGIDENLANELREAINNDDRGAIGAIMDSVSKHPEAAKFIKPGQGWEGKVYTPQDKEMLEAEINGMDMSLHQKLRHKKALQTQGTIPQVEQEEERFLKFRKRDRTKPSY